MNIAIISPAIYPHCDGGVEFFNYHLMQELAAQGHKIWVFTWFEYDWKNENITNVKLSRRSLLFVVPTMIFHTLLALKKLKHQIDVIHVPYTSNSQFAFPIYLAYKNYKIPYVIFIHGGGMYTWTRKKIQQLFFQSADTIIAVSENIKTEYEKRSKKKIIVMPNLIPFKHSQENKIELLQKYNLKNNIIILYLGAIKKIKGIDNLINAFMNLGLEYVENKKVKLIICGNGPLKKSLDERVDLMGFKEYIKFLGYINEKQKLEYLKMSDIYVIPSHFEAQSISLFEAMYNGLAIIGSDTKGINNIITDGDNGLLFPVDNQDALKNKLMLLIDNENLRLDFSRKSENYYNKHFNYDEWLKKLIQIYASSLK
ncbi:Glycosyltransferase Gtf1 [uncultured archaeon]|nr:Glycosyltransferase Gtf1 [uncultured archaeon]